MFNLKNIVNKITDRGKEVQPSYVRDSDEDSSLKAEGFLCPKCMKEFKNPEDLQKHYIFAHEGQKVQADYAGQQVQADENHTLHDVFFETGAVKDGGSLFHTVDFADIQGDDVSQLQRQLEEALKENANLLIEKKNLEQRAAQLACDNVALKSASDEIHSSQIALKERLKLVEQQLAHRESIDDAAVLRQELVQVQRVMDELTQEKERERDQFKAELQQLKRSYSKAENDVEEQSESKTDLLFELKDTKEKLSEAENNLENEIKNSAKLKYTIMEQSKRIQNFVKSRQQTFVLLSAKFTEMKSDYYDIALLVKNLRSMQDEMKITCGDILNTISIKAKETTDILIEKEKSAKLEKAQYNMLKQEKDELKLKLNDNSQFISKLQRSITDLENKIRNLESTLSETKDTCTRLLSERTELLSQIQEGEGVSTALQQLSEENLLLKHHLGEMSEKERKIMCENEAVVSDLRNSIDNLTSSLRETLMSEESFKKKAESLLEDLEQARLKEKETESLLYVKETEVKEMKNKYEDILKSKQKCEKEILDLNESLLFEKRKNGELDQLHNSKMIESKVHIQELEDKINVFSEEASSLKIEIQTLKKSLKESSIREKNYETTLSEVSLSMDELKKHENHLETEVLKLADEKKKLLDQIHSLEEESKKNEILKASLETSLFELQKLTTELESDKYEMEKSLTEKIHTLQAEIIGKQSIIDEIQEDRNLILKTMAELTDKNSLLVSTLSECKSAAEKKQKELEKENESQKKLIESVVSDLNDEKVKVTSLQDELVLLKEAHSNNLQDKDDQLKLLQASLDDVMGEKLALEARVEACTLEQRTLLERCYASASETENLRRTINETRHRLEESQAALHELGRENQTLQLEVKKHLERKWAEDSDVKNCTLCQKEFTLIFRKHHCRNCGKIFCSECSSKMAPVEDNKKPVRVCDGCYNELSTK